MSQSVYYRAPVIPVKLDLDPWAILAVEPPRVLIQSVMRSSSLNHLVYSTPGHVINAGDFSAVPVISLHPGLDDGLGFYRLLQVC